MQNEIVTTWANGFGVWHCKIEFPSPGYGPQYLDANIDRIRAKARRTIRREIDQRETVGSKWQCHIEVADNEIDHMNRMQSITFREKVEDEFK